MVSEFVLCDIWNISEWCERLGPILRMALALSLSLTWPLVEIPVTRTTTVLSSGIVTAFPTACLLQASL